MVRYIKPSLIRKVGTVDGHAFVLRMDDSGVSVNWLEYFSGLNSLESFDRIRKLIRLELKKNGRFAKIERG